ncbi:MAG: tetraacyldisaccharide 4'-kinase, partial [Pseudomonadota bacterium]
YGGRATGPLRVDPARHTADEVGDEPLLLAAFAPVWVAKDRARGAAAAIADGAKILVLDDGYQDPSLAHDLSILVVDAARGFGNGHAIPAGPLREAIAPGLARADLVIAIGTVEARTDFIATWGHAMSVPILGAMLRPLPTGLPLSGTPVLAFAGIADPARFFATLRGLGADLRKAIPLADHQPLAPTLISRLLREARAEGAIVVTTEKDAVRLPAALRQQITALPVRLSLENDTELSDRLAAVARTRNGAKASV